MDELYTRLDAERTRTKARYNAALGDGGTVVQRDAEVCALANQGSPCPSPGLQLKRAIGRVLRS